MFIFFNTTSKLNELNNYKIPLSNLNFPLLHAPIAKIPCNPQNWEEKMYSIGGLSNLFPA
jgi:hypothetical protein